LTKVNVPAFVTRNGVRYGAIIDVDRLEPFLMHLVGNGDVWAYVGSNGPFTAGRVDPDGALFPYVTADKLLRHADESGARTILRVGPDRTIWEPWTAPKSDGIRRNLYKRIDSTEIVFEEIEEALGLRLEWSLTTSTRFGVVREVRLVNEGRAPAAVEYLDGWHQIVPPGIGVNMWNQLSYLTTSYGRAEVAGDVPLAVYALNAMITDHPEANESLRSACAWSFGHERPAVLLNSAVVDEFRAGKPLDEIRRGARQTRGTIGAYLVAGELRLEPGAIAEWVTVADTRRDAAAIADLRARLRDPQTLRRDLDESVAHDRRELRRRVAGADGIQHTSDETASVHHYTSVLFNVMRGGTFTDSYRFPCADFRRHVAQHSRKVAARHKAWLDALPEELELTELRASAQALGDRQLDRIVDTYLPITFSRRHGDPSRPWNRFSIRLEDEAGSPLLGYEGNWRDIFQNWEAVGQSFPGWLNSFISIFLNASTADGYNPYRVTKEGIDWELPNPSDPWASIGYWGDHQLVYLARLLGSEEAHYPGSIRKRLADECFGSVRVPYRIKPLDAILRDPRHTIEFDEDLHRRLIAGAAETGADAKLVAGPDGEPQLVSLAEKLLLPLLVKLTNFVPDGGIWLNTQRPEWNDANNALAGWGLSVVTVAHARRYLTLIGRLFEGAPSFRVSAPVATLLREVAAIFAPAPEAFDDGSRYQMLEALGRAGERHRQAVYSGATGKSGVPGPSVELDSSAVEALIAGVRPVLDATLRSAHRPDGLFDGYDVLEVEGRRAHVRRLYPMLEGQVAILSSGLLSPAESLEVLRTLRSSSLYRADQTSYLLYPDMDLPSLFEKNTLPEPPPLEDARLFTRDRTGGWHFQGDIRNVADVAARLDAAGASRQVRATVLDLWERTFHHAEFTGRSRTFFMFEGLGSIYWHMIAKLLLAVQETFLAVDPEREPEAAAGLAAAYEEIRDGLGFRKTAAEYGAFPTDPYSHTPRHRKAQQPGMTGLVKEEILSRWGELGVQVEAGCVRFAPRLLHRSEFAAEPFDFAYVDLAGRDQVWHLPAGSLAFTFCGTPVCYRLGDTSAIKVEMAGGRTVELGGDALPAELSPQLFSQSGTIARIEVVVQFEAFPMTEARRDE
jgi:hypothetical protein